MSTPVATELQRRAATFSAATTDEANHSIEATVVSGEMPVTVFDWQRFAPIDEVLVLRGAQLPDGVPLLDAHQRFSFQNVLGSVRDWQRGSAISGRVFFDTADELGQRAFSKAKGGFLRSVSAGYEVTDAEEIAPGEKATVGGREWKAGKLWLRIANKWTVREVSLVPIGADAGAGFRDWPTHGQRQETIDHRLAAELTDHAELFARELGVDRTAIVRDLAGALAMPAAAVNRILAGELPCPADRLDLIRGVLEVERYHGERPYKIKKAGKGKYVLYDKGKKMGTHPSKAAAQKQIEAIEASKHTDN